MTKGRGHTADGACRKKAWLSLPRIIFPFLRGHSNLGQPGGWKESAMSLIVHHLNNSRSQRILWLLAEIGAPYEIRFYARDPETNLAPAELLAVHPPGRSPVIADDGRVII